MQGCCHRTAKSSNLGPEAGKTFDLTDLPNKDYGPVVNDASECIEILWTFKKVSRDVGLNCRTNTLNNLPLHTAWFVVQRIIGDGLEMYSTWSFCYGDLKVLLYIFKSISCTVNFYLKRTK